MGGDIVQVLPGKTFTDDNTAECHHEGEVATVIGLHAKESREPGAVVSWMPSGHTSTISRRFWKSFHVFRNPQLRIGDLLLKSSGSENPGEGDAGSVLSLKHVGEGSIQIYWMRTGQISECPMNSWSSQFRWIPLQSTSSPYADRPAASAGMKPL